MKRSVEIALGLLIAAIAAWALRNKNGRGLLQVMMAGAIVAAVFLALNPAWWSSPLDAAHETLTLRAQLMTMQTSAFGSDASVGASANGFVRYAILETPQYFEVPFWQEIGPSIADYSASPWVLPPLLNTLRALITTVFAATGIVVLVRRRDRVAWIAGAWITVTMIVTLCLTPLPWGRYYLPALPALYALAAAGATTLLRPSSADAVIGGKGESPQPVSASSGARP